MASASRRTPPAKPLSSVDRAALWAQEMGQDPDQLIVLARMGLPLPGPLMPLLTQPKPEGGFLRVEPSPQIVRWAQHTKQDPHRLAAQVARWGFPVPNLPDLPPMPSAPPMPSIRPFGVVAPSAAPTARPVPTLAKLHVPAAAPKLEAKPPAAPKTRRGRPSRKAEVLAACDALDKTGAILSLVKPQKVFLLLPHDLTGPGLSTSTLYRIVGNWLKARKSAK